MNVICIFQIIRKMEKKSLNGSLEFCASAISFVVEWPANYSGRSVVHQMMWIFVNKFNSFVAS